MLLLFLIIIKNDIIDILAISRYFNSLASETLSFSAEIFVCVSFVTRYSIVNLNDDEKECELNISIDDKSFEFVIISA